MAACSSTSMQESTYVASLDAQAKQRYSEKLSCVGLSMADDPYLSSNDDKYVNDMTTWPSIEYGHIFGYFVTRPGVYTQQELLSWKQMDAYNFFQAGYVRTVFSYQFGPGKCMVVLKARVNPSQRSPDDSRMAWIISKRGGEIVCAHCTCMAGLGESCSHVAAVMFKVECAVRLGHTSLTSQSCKWNDTFCKKIRPSLVVDVQFGRPKLGKDATATAPVVAKKYRSLLSKDAFLTGLQNVAPSAVVLSSAFLSTNQPSHSPARKVRKLPEPLTSLHHSKYQKMSPDELKTACEEIFANGLKISSEEAAYLEESTRLQSQCLLWFEQRAGRITASMFRKVTRTSIDNPSQSLLSSLMQESKFDSMKVPALRWGIVKEDEARAEYLARASDDHVELMHESAGLHVNPNFPHLGASPDGVVTCECCGTGVLEIKCPFKYRHLHPHSITDPGFCLVHSSDSGVHLSHEHDYYYQVQGQLAVCDVEYCDFICWTPLGFHHERILTDSQFFATVKPVLDRFFVRVMLPRLLTGGNEHNVVAKRPAQPTLYCWCGGEEEGRMVACDNDSCLIEWFHFECVGLTRRPRGKWFCCEECETQSKKK